MDIYERNVENRGGSDRVWPVTYQKRSDEPHLASLALCASRIPGRGDGIVTHFKDRLSESVDGNQGLRKEVAEMWNLGVIGCGP